MALPYELPNINQEFAKDLYWRINSPRSRGLKWPRVVAGTLAFADSDPQSLVRRRASYHTTEGILASTRILNRALEATANRREPSSGQCVGIKTMKGMVARTAAGLGGVIVDGKGTEVLSDAWEPLPIPPAPDSPDSKEGRDSLATVLLNGLDRVGTFLDFDFSGYTQEHFPDTLRHRAVTARVHDSVPPLAARQLAPFRTLYNLMVTEETLPILEDHERHSNRRNSLREFWEVEKLNAPDRGASRVLIATYAAQLAHNLNGVLVPAPQLEGPKE